jgi:hypothetical protein
MFWMELRQISDDYYFTIFVQTRAFWICGRGIIDYWMVHFIIGSDRTFKVFRHWRNPLWEYCLSSEWILFLIVLFFFEVVWLSVSDFPNLFNLDFYGQMEFILLLERLLYEASHWILCDRNWFESDYECNLLLNRDFGLYIIDQAVEKRIKEMHVPISGSIRNIPEQDFFQEQLGCSGLTHLFRNNIFLRNRGFIPEQRSYSGTGFIRE